jgi:hypothetical protein
MLEKLLALKEALTLKKLGLLVLKYDCWWWFRCWSTNRKEVLGRKASDTPEDQAIADLDKLAADEEAEAAGTELVSEEDLFAEEAAGRIAPEDTVPATLEELKKLDKDLKKKSGSRPNY